MGAAARTLTRNGLCDHAVVYCKARQGVATPLNILERGRACLQLRPALAERSPWDWQRCPQCGRRLTIKHGSYTRRPGFFTGRQRVRGPRHVCHAGTQSYAEQAALLVRGSWYSREVRRRAVDHWVHGRLSLRRSWLGRQERWRRWRPLDTPPPGAPCDLAASTVPRWLDCAGGVAPARVPGQLQDIAQREEWGPAGLWARLRGGATRVVLRLADSVTGLLWPPLVAEREALAAPLCAGPPSRLGLAAPARRDE